jgi:hypothetical protein
MRRAIGVGLGIVLAIICVAGFFSEWNSMFYSVGISNRVEFPIPLDFQRKICMLNPLSTELEISHHTGESIIQAIENECALMDARAIEECSVPNVVHFVWYSGNEFRLDHFFSIKSVYNAMKPDFIFIHGREFPLGNVHFDRSIAELGLKPVLSRVVTSVYGKPVNVIEHKSDVLRMESLIRFGGVYLDLDVLVLRPLLDIFGENETTIPKENDYGLNGGIIIAKRCSRFMLRWYRAYKEVFDDTCWGCAAINLPKKLADEDQTGIFVDRTNIKSDWPFSGRMVMSSNEDDAFWKDAYAVHTFIRDYPEVKALPETEVIKLNNNYGRIVRNILGDKIGF